MKKYRFEMIVALCALLFFYVVLGTSYRNMVNGETAKTEAIESILDDLCAGGSVAINETLKGNFLGDVGYVYSLENSVIIEIEYHDISRYEIGLEKFDEYDLSLAAVTHTWSYVSEPLGVICLVFGEEEVQNE